MRYRKKPVVIDAAQWFKNGDHPLDYTNEQTGFQNGRLTSIPAAHRKANNWEGDIVRYYRDPWVDGGMACKHCDQIMHEHGWIETLEGGHIVCPGDYIITGVKGEHYPCKPDIFEMTYVPEVGFGNMEEQPTPTGKTLYWDADDGESGPSHDIESLLNNVASNGDLEVGAEVHIVRALELPDMRVRVTKVPEDEDIEYEVITKGNT